MTVESENDIKILHVVRQAEGGMRRHVIELLSGLSGRFIHTLAAAPEFYKSLPETATKEVEFLPVTIGDNPGPATILQAYMLARYAKRQGIDIIHSHGYKAAVPGAISAMISNSKSVITGHNLFPANSSWLARTSIRLAARYSSRVIAVAPSLAESLVAAGVERSKIAVIPNGIDISAYGGEVDRSTLCLPGINQTTPVILCAARLTEVKGVAHLIHAAGIISTERPDVRVLIAGDGPDRSALENLARQTAPENIIFLGHREDIPKLLSAADVITIPSLAEGHPLMLVEAMASKKPIVASNVGGLADVITDGENGLLVPPADPQALAQALLKMISSPELASGLGHTAREYAENEFTVERMLARTEEVYLCVAF